MNASYTKMNEHYDEDTRKKRVYYWDTAIGLNKVDGLTPSEYLLDLKEDSLGGRKSYAAIESELNAYYKNQPRLTPELLDKRECDIVSTRIAKILESRDFVFSPVTLLNIHKRLFEGLFAGELVGYEGRFRDYNISKAEPVLNGKSVIYADYDTLTEYLKYDFDNEAATVYSKLNHGETAKKLAKFVSSIWQVHPFAEGNTRTTAVFLEKYMTSLGYENIDNSLFRDNSVYFRNALAVSNYTNAAEGVSPDLHYLEAFIFILIEKRERALPEIVIRTKRSEENGF